MNQSLKNEHLQWKKIFNLKNIIDLLIKKQEQKIATLILIHYQSHNLLQKNTKRYNFTYALIVSQTTKPKRYTKQITDPITLFKPLKDNRSLITQLFDYIHRKIHNKAVITTLTNNEKHISDQKSIRFDSKKRL